MNGYKAIGYACFVFASIFLIYGYYRGIIAQGPPLNADENWYNFTFTFTPFALQAVAFYVIGGIGVYYGRRNKESSPTNQ